MKIRHRGVQSRKVFDSYQCIDFYTDTFIFRYNEVTEKHAFEEAEGDRSLEHWKEVHHKFFSEYGNFKEDEKLLCERFEVVYK